MASTTGDGLTTGLAEMLGGMGLDVVAGAVVADGDATIAPIAANVSGGSSGVGCPCGLGYGAATSVMNRTLNVTMPAARPDANRSGWVGRGVARGLSISFMPLGLLSWIRGLTMDRRAIGAGIAILEARSRMPLQSIDCHAAIASGVQAAHDERPAFVEGGPLVVVVRN